MIAGILFVGNNAFASSYEIRTPEQLSYKAAVRHTTGSGKGETVRGIAEYDDGKFRVGFHFGSMPRDKRPVYFELFDGSETGIAWQYRSDLKSAAPTLSAVMKSNRVAGVAGFTSSLLIRNWSEVKQEAVDWEAVGEEKVAGRLCHVYVARQPALPGKIGSSAENRSQSTMQSQKAWVDQRTGLVLRYKLAIRVNSRTGPKVINDEYSVEEFQDKMRFPADRFILPPGTTVHLWDGMEETPVPAGVKKVLRRQPGINYRPQRKTGKW